MAPVPLLDAPSPPTDRELSPLHEHLQRKPRCYQWAQLPTPVVPLPWLQREGVEAWIKRDDQSSSIYGGGKVRKLEWLLANPPHDRPVPIVSVGGIGSHHLVALSLFARELGRRLHAWTFEQEPTAHVCKNLAVLASTGTRFWHVGTRVALPLAWARYHGWQRPAPMGKWLAAGASTPLGCFGFVAAGLELAQQIRAGDVPRPGTVYLAAGTGGTAAGLALGLALAGVRTHLRLVATVERWAFNPAMFLLKAQSVYGELRKWGLAVEDPPRWVASLFRRAGLSWSIDAGRVGAGYGHPTEAALAIERLARDHALVLETTYTAKCLAALRSDLDERSGFVPRGPVLFWNTHAANDLSQWIEPDWQQSLPPPLQKFVSSNESPGA